MLPVVEAKSDEILVVGCSAQKADRMLPAEQLYVSPRFLKSRSLAQQMAGKWFIVSGKYGLVSPEAKIEPYDLLLSSLPENAKQDWAESVVRSLMQNVSQRSCITVIAGEPYASSLKSALIRNKMRARLPFLGMDEVTTEWLDDAIGASPRSRHLSRFYSSLSRLSEARERTFKLKECGGANNCPQRGVYYFYEDSQHRFGLPRSPRVVRVGTHAVSAGSKATLWNRLRTHRGTGDGGGNHRSSIMRLHIGAAMLARDGVTGQLPSWGRGQNAERETQMPEEKLERLVSEFIGEMRVLWIEIGDDPSPSSDRAYVEQNSIALLSGRRGPLDCADTSWLGFFSPVAAIRKSGLWNIDYVDQTYDPDFLDVFDTYVNAALGNAPQPKTSIAPGGWHSQKYGNDVKGQLRLY